MAEPAYTYSWHTSKGQGLRGQKRIGAAHNPLRLALAVIRYVREPGNMDAVAALQGNLLGSPLTRRFTSLEKGIDALARDSRTKDRLERLGRFPPIALERLAALPPGTLGHTLADHLGSRGYNPNIVEIPGAIENARERLVIQHLFATHDVWHVATGFGTDGPGELGIIGFYAAQLGGPPFLASLLSLLLLNGILLRPETLPDRLSAFAAGYEAGRRAEPLFGLDWPALWATPLVEVRSNLKLADARIVGEGVHPTA